MSVYSMVYDCLWQSRMICYYVRTASERNAQNNKHGVVCDTACDVASACDVKFSRRLAAGGGVSLSYGQMIVFNIFNGHHKPNLPNVLFQLFFLPPATRCMYKFVEYYLPCWVKVEKKSFFTIVMNSIYSWSLPGEREKTRNVGVLLWFVYNCSRESNKGASGGVEGEVMGLSYTVRLGGWKLRAY